MSSEDKEKMLDLLCDKFVYGLSEDETRKLEELGFDPEEAKSIEQTVAALSLAGLDTEAEIPDSLRAKLTTEADKVFGSKEPESDTLPQREITLDGGTRSWFDWLGWATAVAASIALVISLFVPRGGEYRVEVPPTPTPEERPDIRQQRQRLMASAGVIKAELKGGNMAETAKISGDVVWSDAEQTGYVRLNGLPMNDKAKETYQLWIYDETQDKKTPIDGGVFDITSEGEVIIPIDAKLKARNPSTFAITVEKPGGVVVSKGEKVAALAPVKPNQV
jgi:anti-sigma-K factor RskA